MFALVLVACLISGLCMQKTRNILTRYRFNVVPSSVTLAQHETNTGSSPAFAGHIPRDFN